MRLRRRAGWEGRLADYIAACRARAFERGSFDCALFAADWVFDLTGIDFAAEYRGRYRTRRGADRLLREIAAGDLIAATTRALGAPLASPLLARRGDVAALRVVGPDGPDTMALGIVDAEGSRIALIGMDGLTHAPLSAAVAAWAVG